MAAGVTVLAYARSPAAGLTPAESARYLTVLQISLPAALWPLWLAGVAANADSPWPRAASGPGRGCPAWRPPACSSY